MLVTSNSIIDLDPWWFLFEREKSAEFWLSELRTQYPERCLVPFATKIPYSDDFACFDGEDTSGNPKVYYIHAYASPGWEGKEVVADFDEWLKLAQEESSCYKSEQIEDDK